MVGRFDKLSTGVDSAWEQKKLAASLSPAPLSCAGSADRPGKNACKSRTANGIAGSQQDNYIGDLVSHTLLLIGRRRYGTSNQALISSKSNTNGSKSPQQVAMSTVLDFLIVPSMSVSRRISLSLK